MNANRSSQWLIDHARGRSAAVAKRIENAKKLIEKEIEKSGGLYPLNRGRLSRAEVCRRAGIASSVLDGPSHKQSTLLRLNDWLAVVRGGITSGGKQVRKLVTQRADEWKERSQRYANRTHLYHLEMISQKSELAAAHQRIRELESEVVSFRAAASRGRVVPLRDPKRRL